MLRNSPLKRSSNLSISGIQELTWTSLRVIGRLNRDYNPLIQRRDYDPSIERTVKAAAVLNEDFCKVCVEEQIIEMKVILFLLGILVILTALAFYKRNNWFGIIFSSSTNNDDQTFNGSGDCELFKKGVPSDLLKKLHHLYSLLSVLPTKNNDYWRINLSSAEPINPSREFGEIELSETSDLSHEKYWTEVGGGLRDSLNALKTLIDDSGRPDCPDTADKSIQVNEQLMFQLLRDDLEGEDRFIKSRFPVEFGDFSDMSIYREHQQLEPMTNGGKLSPRRAIYIPNSPYEEMQLIDIPQSNFNGNTLNIQIDFDRKVWLGKLAN